MQSLKFFHNFTLLDGESESPMADAVLVVEGERITAVGQSADFGSGFEHAARHDLNGLTVLPGLVNMHEHLTWRRGYGDFRTRVVQQPAEGLLLRGFGNALISLVEGVTTVRDTGSKGGLALELRRAVAAGNAHGPRILSVGAPIAITGGHGSGAVRTADGAAAVRRAAREQLKAGADWIKLMASGGFAAQHGDKPTSTQFTPDEMRAAFDEAHKAGKPATVHAHPPDAIRTAIESGVDCIEHAGLVDRTTAELIASEKVYVVPTLTALRMEVEQGPRMGRPDWLIDLCRPRLAEQPATFQLLLEAGCRIVTGVDSLGDLQNEIGFMVDFGMSPLDAIRAATSVPAQCLGLDDRIGRLRQGMIADFIAVDGDPLASIDSLRNVKMTVSGGTVYDPAVLLTAVGPGLVTSFRPEGGGIH